MWRTQDILHKKPQLVPGTLLLIASSLVVYRHMTHVEMQHQQGDVLKTFLAMILVQMLPLVALELKIMSCADPVGVFCQFATPVTLVHAIFLGMRLCLYENYDFGDRLIFSTAFVGALVAILVGYRQHWSCIFCCKGVWGIVGLALSASYATAWLDNYVLGGEEHWDDLFHIAFETSNSYIEILAFVPAVWMVYREDKSTVRFEVESKDTARTSAVFFIFLVGFYLCEDLFNAYNARAFYLVAFAHILHFLLLLDFGVYVLAHVYNPEKLVGELRKWLPVDFSQNSWEV